ncbi:efflux RND transporter periplasmic adaptor subunit [Sphingomonas sp. BIUV-7]|uniref:Efflux RND transporter periplasmic adaptor subunit n=1 Tax=Sphingomonas natans TaxID=3063330 RepID=A0ABT8YC93_9SPHN|nr:efflux RND transporter periplasmic adaptor subunit [Sphingomonas sp. BIUV-7]MDO6415602.1 efflux RND transporter periplasmic adaptor subunit [Sphingomonas sp. BIUV-7]
MTALILLAACSGGDKAKQGGKGKPTPTVGYVVVQPTSVDIVTELSGRTNAFESSDVRPQVNGIIRRRLFTEGSLVQRGQILYEIDPRLYRAAVNEARANLQSARANAEATKILADRYKPLADMEAISRQDYTNAIASARQATASVGQTSAALDTAQINLKFTTVPAPITGRIGRSLFTVGALVSASQTDPLAQIQRLDPMFVDIQQSAADMLALRRSLGRNGIVATRADVKLTLEDGEAYGPSGSVEFSEAIVNRETGTVTLRARFPNPQGLLLPGMFVRARFAQAINNRAFLVPQAAVARDAKGNATLFVVDKANKAVQKTIKADRTQGAYWVVTSGLEAGDRIVTQGLSKLVPNQAVKPVPETEAQRIEAPSKDQLRKSDKTSPNKAG